MRNQKAANFGKFFKSNTTEAKQDKGKICYKWIWAPSALNIPLHITGNPYLRDFLDSHVVNGGAIPKSSQFHDRYIFEVHEMEKEELKNCIRNKKMALIWWTN